MAARSYRAGPPAVERARAKPRRLAQAQGHPMMARPADVSCPHRSSAPPPGASSSPGGSWSSGRRASSSASSVSLSAPPFTILFLRFALAALLMAAAALPLRSAWPRSRRQAAHLAVVGILLQTVYLGGCYAAMAAGLPAGITALIVGLQPILIATVVGPLLGERVGPKHWLGLALGFVGVALVLWDKLDIAGLKSWGVVFALGGLLGITAATLYQKRFCGSGRSDHRHRDPIRRRGADDLAHRPRPGLGSRSNGPGPSSSRWPGSPSRFPSARSPCCSGSSARRGLQGREPLLPDPAGGSAGELSSPGETLAAPALAGMALTAVGVALVNRA